MQRCALSNLKMGTFFLSLSSLRPCESLSSSCTLYSQRDEKVACDERVMVREQEVSSNGLSFPCSMWRKWDEVKGRETKGGGAVLVREVVGGEEIAPQHSFPNI